MKRVSSDFEPEYKIRKLFHVGGNMTEDLYFINTQRAEYTMASINGLEIFSDFLLSVYSRAGWDPCREKVYFTTNPMDYNIFNFKDVTTKRKEKSYLIYVSSGIILSIAMIYLNFKQCI